MGKSENVMQEVSAGFPKGSCSILKKRMGNKFKGTVTGAPIRLSIPDRHQWPRESSYRHQIIIPT